MLSILGTNEVDEEATDNPQEELEDDDIDYDKEPICGCIPHLWKGSIGIVDYHVNPIVMIGSMVIIWSFVLWCGLSDNAQTTMQDANNYANYYFGWLYIAALLIFGSFCIFLMFSRFGDIKLGKPNQEPKYSLLSWFSMLFSAGIGVGLYFYGVSEPISHFTSAQSGSSRWSDGQFNQNAADALNIAWFHWGFTASSVYCVAALPLAYHHHVKGRPLRESTCMEPLLGKKYANGIIGQLIDITSVIGTMFGVATSLGLGVFSINAGLFFIFGVEESTEVQLMIIWTITAFATVSVFTGLDAGIRRLSEMNFAFSFILIFFLFFAGQPTYLMNLFIQGLGYHAQFFFELTFSTQAFEQEGFYDQEDGQNQDTKDFMGSWTIFYWAWWIAWAPFVGIFIAQISEGRTVREFIMGNMMVPTLLTCICLTIFGGVGLWNEMASTFNGVECPTNGTVFNDWQPEEVMSKWNATTIDGPVEKDVIMLSCFDTAHRLFALLYALPLPKFMSTMAMIGIITYFVTSSDSASHVIDVLTANGNEEPPRLQRIFWALSEGAVASVLLSLGDGGEALSALQTVSLIGAFPFTFVLLGEVMATYKTFRIHLGELDVDQLVYWRYDIIEAIFEDKITFILAAICPPLIQMRTRLMIVNRNEELREIGDNRFNDGFARGLAQDVWITGYFSMWILIIIFEVLQFYEDGFVYLARTMEVFYLVMSVGNRQLIKAHYGIDSSNILFDVLAWGTCCCCFAGVQENLQAQQGHAIDLKVNCTPKKNQAGDEAVALVSAERDVEEEWME